MSEGEVHGWGWDLALCEDEHASPAPYERGWARRITEWAVAGAVCAPGVVLTFKRATPDLMLMLTARKEPLMLPAPPTPAGLLPPAPLLPARRPRTAVARFRKAPLLRAVVLDIDAEIARVTATHEREIARLSEAKARLLALDV